MKPAQIAEDLGRPLQTVKSQLQRGKQILKEALKEKNKLFKFVFFSKLTPNTLYPNSSNKQLAKITVLILDATTDGAIYNPL